MREIEETSPKVKIGELDTIIVPAREEGFNRVFLGENCFDVVKIKYIAAYETSSISAINYYAEVLSIEKYKDTNKYFIYFKNNAIKLDKSVKIGENKTLAPQNVRYTSFAKLLKAKKLKDIFR